MELIQEILYTSQNSIEMSRRENWNLLQLKTFQHQRLKQLVDYAIENSPFYRKLYRSYGVDSFSGITLQDLPIINKKVMMENFDEIVTDPNLKLDALSEFLSSVTQDNYFRGKYKVFSTSGTTGMPGVVVYDVKGWSNILAETLRSARYKGVSPKFPNRIRLSCIITSNLKHISANMIRSDKLGAYRIQKLSATDSIDNLVRCLNEFQPNFLYGYPSIITRLAMEQFSGALKIHPQVISTGAEVLTLGMREKIHRVWGIKPFDDYGCSEAGFVATDCSFHQGMHIFEDQIILESVDDHNQPVPNGQPGSKVLLTNLFNYVQPIIRYEINDVVTLDSSPCKCGMPFCRVIRIDGRHTDVISLSSTPEKAVSFVPQDFDFLNSIPEIKHFQINYVQRDALINITVVPVAGTNREILTTLVKLKLREKLESLNVMNVNTQVDFVDKIVRDAERMGKSKVVQCS